MSRARLSPILLAAMAFGTLLSAAEPAEPTAEAHRADVEAWRTRRMASLKRDDGWLTLVGLFWLQPGENRFGSDPKTNRIVFPAGTAPKTMGSLDLSGGKVTLRADPGAGLTSKGQPITTMTLTTDKDGESTVLEHGRIRFYVIDRGGRLAVRVKDSQSPVLLAFHGIDSYPIDGKWRFDARFEAYDPPKVISVPSILGTVDKEESPGAVVFRLGGNDYRIDAVREPGETDLFLIFGDQTNGEETYGGGRFLYAKPPDKDGRVVVDFNKAYNPPCVFTPYATCPLPPAQNRLPIRVEAGEKKYDTH
jgi:uncharacterized protein (DUF1684 family)